MVLHSSPLTSRILHPVTTFSLARNRRAVALKLVDSGIALVLGLVLVIFVSFAFQAPGTVQSVFMEKSAVPQAVHEAKGDVDSRGVAGSSLPAAK